MGFLSFLASAALIRPLLSCAAALPATSRTATTLAPSLTRSSFRARFKSLTVLEGYQAEPWLSTHCPSRVLGRILHYGTMGVTCSHCGAKFTLGQAKPRAPSK